MKPTVNFGSRPRVRKRKCLSVCFQWLQLREVHLEVCELQVLVKFVFGWNLNAESGVNTFRGSGAWLPRP